MSRKFRVWDVENKEYIHPARCFIDGNGEFYYKCDDGKFYNWKEDFIIEFSTGIEIKGKELYDGDKVIVMPGYCGDNFYNSIIGFIEYDAPSFYVIIDDKGNIPGQDFDWNKLEIIGTIHDEEIKK